ncbi:type-F conjugative transfer system pilin assembly protein TraF (plasmid) [Erwinia pyrifoliae]|uniref:type-F conjugative transfer system pilin assembly protein TraF n=1 Tax=Erwinia pyrifoliae TaxID=79967 RepID=UPI0021C112E4|nr:type-F conjugative transfer system pilin assembly protein TraF [Erwinia pyrifoliae]UXK14275.1 type-F conjugative transfer system pilin assembly protein TraF [Erwinia pyrifoliae]
MRKACYLILATAGLIGGHVQASDTRLGGFPDSEAQGWIWYNEPVSPDEDEPPSAPPPSAISPENATELKEKLQAATKAALDKAIMFPSAENFRRYKLLQDFWAEKSSQFAQSSKEALLKFPELDYNLRYSHYNGTASTRQAIQRQREKEALVKLSADNGLFYFYRGKEPVDVLMGIVVRSFVKEYGINLIYVSVDGKFASELPGSRPDVGQTDAMHITHYPALFLVNPRTEAYQPLAYGFHSQEDLASQFLLVATDFAPGF